MPKQPENNRRPQRQAQSQPRGRVNLAPGLPTRKQVLDFIAQSDTAAGKREISRAFGLQGQEKIALKALLRDMADEGLIDGKKTAFHRMGGVPKVTVLRVVAIEDGEAIAIPDSWQPDDATPPPRIRLIEKGRQSALKVTDRVLARTEEAGAGWLAHPMIRSWAWSNWTEPERAGWPRWTSASAMLR